MTMLLTRVRIAVAQLGLGLALELGLGQLDGNDAGDALPAVFAGYLVIVLENLHLLAVIIEHRGQGPLEALLVHAALRGVDVVGEGDDVLAVPVVVLEGHLRHGVVLLSRHVDHIGVDRVLGLVEEGHKLPDAAGVVHGVLLLPTGALINGMNFQSGVEEGLLPHAGVEGVVAVLGDLKHLGVGLEHHLGAVAVCVPHHLHGLGHLAPGELHLVDLALLVNPHFQPLGQGVDHAGAHAVEAAGHLIAAAAEFAAGVEDREHHLQGGQAGLGLDIHGNAPAVVDDGDDVPFSDLDGNLVAVAGQGLVDGVVHDLVHQVVQAALRRGADIHAGALADGLQALQHLDSRAAVLVLHLGSAVLEFFRHLKTSIGISGRPGAAPAAPPQEPPPAARLGCLFEAVALRPPEQRGGGQLGEIDGGLPARRAAEDKRLGQIRPH